MWKESNFEWTEKGLISLIPDILKDLNLKPQIERGKRAVTDFKIVMLCFKAKNLPKLK